MNLPPPILACEEKATATILAYAKLEKNLRWLWIFGRADLDFCVRGTALQGRMHWIMETGLSNNAASLRLLLCGNGPLERCGLPTPVTLWKRASRTMRPPYACCFVETGLSNDAASLRLLLCGNGPLEQCGLPTPVALKDLIFSKRVRKRTRKLYSQMDDERFFFLHRSSSIGEYSFLVLFLTCLPYQRLLAFSSQNMFSPQSQRASR